MAVESSSKDLINVVALLGAAVVAVPIFRRIGLGSVLGYLTAGVVIGPFGIGLFKDPASILHTAELGVVMFLFVIGLEMRPRHLWGLRRSIFGLGTLQIAACTLLLWGVGIAFDLAPKVALIGGLGFVLTSTAIVMQILTERGDIALPPGQRIVAILLFEDLLIVPLLALVAVLAPESAVTPAEGRWGSLLLAIGALAGLIVVGIWGLNPIFRLLAAAKAREVMTAAALLVVLGAALVMQVSGLSMAMGAFVAGVLLSESTFRHQIEADIEPFRGILLGLFFLSVGMSLDLDVVGLNLPLVLGGVAAMMTAKALAIWAVARYLGADRREALDRAVLMAQGGEFAFVLYTAAAQVGVISADENASLTAIVVMSMVLTPLTTLLVKRFMPAAAAPSLDGISLPDALHGSVLMVGFGRFGQVTSQSLLARDVDVTIIDNDIEMIQSAEQFGFKIYYGDGTRLDVLHASGAHHARAILVCIDDRKATSRIVELTKQHFPQARVLARSFDREHALELVAHGADVQLRETFESALRFGELALRELGVDPDEAAEIAAGVRRRDAERFELELGQGLGAGLDKLLGNVPKPTPFTQPKRDAQLLNEEDAAAAREPAPTTTAS